MNTCMVIFHLMRLTTLILVNPVSYFVFFICPILDNQNLNLTTIPKTNTKRTSTSVATRGLHRIDWWLLQLSCNAEQQTISFLHWDHADSSSELYSLQISPYEFDKIKSRYQCPNKNAGAGTLMKKLLFAYRCSSHIISRSQLYHHPTPTHPHSRQLKIDLTIPVFQQTGLSPPIGSDPFYSRIPVLKCKLANVEQNVSPLLHYTLYPPTL